MAIPRSQCDVWQNQGATATAKATHESIRNALFHDRSPLKGKVFEVYLQGSYKNDTNIRGDSDVDIVVQLNQTVWWDTSDLTDRERVACNNSFTPATYSLAEFDADVQQALTAYFGASSVTPNNRCITVRGGNGRLNADVVVAGQYRRYLHFSSVPEQTYVEGITLWGRNDGIQVVNYPKVHYANGVSKNASTGGNYKPSVRMIKNARTYLVARQEIPEDLSPSYFVECWLYNLPDDRFVNDSSVTFYNVLTWLEGNTQWDQFVCQNRQFYLFGPLSVQWSLDSARRLHAALVHLWNDWDR